MFRSRIRNYRLFYKPEARGLYRSVFSNWKKSYFLPFYGKANCVFRKHDGSAFIMPGKHWPMLAATCRLINAGAEVTWTDRAVEAHRGEYHFIAPPDCRLFGLSMQSIFVDDEWRFGQLDLKGKVAVNVGGHIGIVAVALAKRGATVHVFEPFDVFVEYIRKNALANNVADKIVIHPVGLSDGNRVVVDNRELGEMASHTHGCANAITSGRLVDAVEYCRKNGIKDISLLEMNCEGCEYHVLTQALIDLLRPERIHMEYHEGIKPFISLLQKNGYTIHHATDADKKKGKLFAQHTESVIDALS